MKKEGIWGEKSTFVDPDAYESAKAQTSGTTTTAAQGLNEQFVFDAKKESEEGDLKLTDGYRDFLEN